jgi:hypothetical protein
MIISRWILLRMGNNLDKSYREIQHILSSITFSLKSCRIWEYVWKYGTAGQVTDGSIIRRMRFRVLNNQGKKRTLRISNADCFSTSTMVTRTSLNFTFTCTSPALCLKEKNLIKTVLVFNYKGADKSLARPTSRCILFDGENISFDASLVIYINSKNILPIMIINRISGVLISP